MSRAGTALTFRLCGSQRVVRRRRRHCVARDVISSGTNGPSSNLPHARAVGIRLGGSPHDPKEKVMITVESRLLEELRDCAVELRQLAYTLQNGVGEHDLLRLSERMRAAADQIVRSGI